MAKRKTPEAPTAGQESARRGKVRADAVLLPSFNSAVVIQEYDRIVRGQDLGALTNALSDKLNQLLDGDLRQCEAMLLGQAQALQAVFVNLALRANQQANLKNSETLLRLALKAQGQCRATLETLAEMKNPRPVAFVKQANIAHGPQQINNGNAPAHAGENEIQQSQLLETNDGEWLDPGAAGAAGGIDPAMAAVGKVDRSSDGRG